jgi:hypothetical protein
LNSSKDQDNYRKIILQVIWAGMANPLFFLSTPIICP